MSEAEQVTNSDAQSFVNSNEDFVNQSFMDKRLDTTILLNSLEATFRGSRIEYFEDEKGNIVPKFRELGEPLMNTVGLQRIMGWLQSLVGAHTVQGYYHNDDDYEEHMLNLELDLRKDIMNNLVKWEIEDDDYEGLCSIMMHTFRRFFSRSIGDRERQSYNKTVQGREVHHVGGGFNMNPFKRS